MILLHIAPVCPLRGPRIWRHWGGNSWAAANSALNVEFRGGIRLAQLTSPRATLTMPRAPLTWVGLDISCPSAILVRKLILRTEFLSWMDFGIYGRITRLPVGVEPTRRRRLRKRREQRLPLNLNSDCLMAREK